jgi:SAM-dependent methyltransferase
VREGVADLRPWAGADAGSEWSLWRDRLDKLQEWRRRTWNGTPRAADRQRVADQLATEFFKFARIPESGSILEIGCGTGSLRGYVPRRRYWGLDPLLGEPGAAVEAVDAGPSRFVRGVGEKLPFADASFESAMICETLDHANEPARVIEEARRVLKPNGVLAVMQSVKLFEPLPPLRVRARHALGRLKRMMSGGQGPRDADTKMRILSQNELARLVGDRLVVESGITSGAVMFLRALRQDVSAPRIPKREV